jgi:hypothetical protein
MGLIAYRRILPSPTFAQGINGVATPGTEASVMGAYLPTAKYVSESKFRSRGCRGAKGHGSGR